MNVKYCEYLLLIFPIGYCSPYAEFLPTHLVSYDYWVQGVASGVSILITMDGVILLTALLTTITFICRIMGL